MTNEMGEGGRDELCEWPESLGMLSWRVQLFVEAILRPFFPTAVKVLGFPFKYVVIN